MVEQIQPHIIEWQDGFNIGIKSIDLQHEQLATLMNDLYKVGIANGKPSSQVDFIVGELIDYTVYHLDFEADCLFRYNFPGVYQHLEEHELFKEKINWFKHKVKGANSEEVVHLITNLWCFLHKWMFEHSNESDKKFVELLQKNGMK